MTACEGTAIYFFVSTSFFTLGVLCLYAWWKVQMLKCNVRIAEHVTSAALSVLRESGMGRLASEVLCMRSSPEKIVRSSVAKVPQYKADD